MTDDQERQVAAEVEQSHPHWVVLWGCYSRLFWAFPQFQAPKGTIVSAPSHKRLLADMHSVEVEVSANPREPMYSSPVPATPLPHRLSRGQVERGTMSRAAPLAGSPAAASRRERKSSPPPVQRPPATPSSLPRATAATVSWTPHAEDQSSTRNYDPYVPGPYESDPYESHPYESDPYTSWQGLQRR
jgi:hypothetical protein